MGKVVYTAYHRDSEGRITDTTEFNSFSDAANFVSVLPIGFVPIANNVGGGIAVYENKSGERWVFNLTEYGKYNA